MKLKKVIVCIGLALPIAGVAQPTMMGSDAQGFLERGRLMYESRNYVGAIDQLTRMIELPASDEQLEQAELLIALSRFERGEGESLDRLVAFLDEHPNSLLAQQAQMKIGDYYFYRGQWDNALFSYSLVRPTAQDIDANENLLYRKAYCNLRLANYKEAEGQYNRLAQTKRFGDASIFYKAYIDYAEGRHDMAIDRFQHIDPNTELGYQAQYYITQIKYNRQQFADVIAAGSQLLAEENNDYFTAELNRMVGESYYHQGDKTQARTYLSRYFDTPEGDIYRTAAYTMGVLDYEDRNYQKVVDEMTLATDETDALAQSAWLYIGQSRLKLGDEKGAARAFEQSAAMDADRTVRETAFYNYAVTQHMGAKTPFGRSIDMFEQFLNDYPNSKYKQQVEAYLVDTYSTSGDYARALASINRINNPGSQVLRAKQNVLYNLGVQALNNNRTADAIDYLKQAVALGNQDKAVLAESRLWLAEAQYRAGNYKDATSNQMAYVNGIGKGDENYGIAQYNLGYSLYQQRRYAEARKAFQNALAGKTLSPELRADAYNRLGDVNYYLQDFATAQSNYDQAMKEDKNAPKDYAMYQKGVMMALSKQYAQAVDQMDALLKAYPRSQYAPQAMLEKAVALTAMGRTADAVNTYNTLLKSFPKSVEARKGLLQMAVLSRNQGDDQAAIEAYKKVIRTYPSSEEAQAAAEDLKLIFADRGELPQLQRFLEAIPNGPRIDVSELDRLNFEAAEKLAIASKPDISKMREYLAANPTGAYAARAKYYIARHAYNAGNLAEALAGIDDALKGNADASFAEDAMAMRADILMRQGKKTEALKAYQALAEQSSSDDNRTVAELGLLRAAQALKKWDVVKATASTLLQRGGLTAAEEREVTMATAIAAANTGDSKAAEASLKKLAADPQSEQGAQAAVELATLQYEAGNYKAAEKTLNALIDSGTPHHYWLARGFLVMSDVYVKQGRKSDARDYLQSLKNNYPGKEKDIADGIENRLKALKKSK
ncbi:MAG: tetratricopeptide repeat protein [Muribaculaceae bacterium]|nr:tetratricopeptide repeat protein [Muribaculaceae bacterium]